MPQNRADYIIYGAPCTGGRSLPRTVGRQTTARNRCRACTGAKELLQKHKQTFEFIDIDRPHGERAMLQALAAANVKGGGDTIPQIFRRTPSTTTAVYVGGFDDLSRLFKRPETKATTSSDSATTYFEVYGTANCPQCKRARGDLRACGQRCRFVDVFDDDGWNELQDRMMAVDPTIPLTVPQVFVYDGDGIWYLGGSDALADFLVQTVH